MGVSGKRDHAHEFALPGFEYKFNPLTGVSDGLLNWFMEENFIVDKMLTVSGHHLAESTGWHAITHLESALLVEALACDGRSQAVGLVVGLCSVWPRTDCLRCALSPRSPWFAVPSGTR
jgi:hypothetical protein